MNWRVVFGVLLQGFLLQLIPILISAFLTWGVFRIARELSGIRAQLKDIRKFLAEESQGKR